MLASYKRSLHAAFVVVFCFAIGLDATAQSNSALISGTVLDPSGAVVANALVEVHKLSATLTDQPRRIVRGNSVSLTFHLIHTT